MMPVPSSRERLLAIDPVWVGFGFAVLEGAELIDWGVKHAKGSTAPRGLSRVLGLVEFYHPHVIVVENVRTKESRRCSRVRGVIDAIGKIACDRSIPCHAVRKTDMRAVFAHVRPANKHGIAEEVARIFPELAPWLPPIRKLWMSENYRMTIFDAIALGLAFRARREGAPAPRSLPAA